MSKWQVINGNSSEVLKGYPDNTFDCVVTDPPYGINFLGKGWDSNTGDREVYEQCLRVLKPGGHLLAFSAARTYHHLAMSVETVGFEIRDQIMWIYGSGFPKSQDVGRQINKRNGVQLDNERYPDDDMILQTNGKYLHKANGKEYTKYPDINGGEMAKVMEGASYGSIYCEVDTNTNEWSGWGTALKPAHEPIVMARKPISEKNIASNCQKHGTGAINIDATRVGDEEITTIGGWTEGHDWESRTTYNKINETHVGRFPSNVVGEISEPYQKYFYCPKVNRKERHIGHTDVKPFDREKTDNGSTGIQVLRKRDPQQFDGNNHPTVKPIELMQYLVKLVTPPNGHILDPFNGSGSTGCAAVELGFDYTGIELDPHYVEIAVKRITACEERTKPSHYENLFYEK